VVSVRRRKMRRTYARRLGVCGTQVFNVVLEVARHAENGAAVS